MRRLQLFTSFAALVLVGLAAFGSSLRAYATFGYIWPSAQVPYYVNGNNLYVPSADAIAAVQSAASNWNTQAGANIQLVYKGTTSSNTLTLDYINNVFFRNDTDSAIATTYWWASTNGQLLDADVVFHEDNVFTTASAGCATGFYIENTGTHELGHVLGLDHSTIDTATMWPYSSQCETTRETLDPDDIAGIQSLYPGSTNTAPTAPSQLVVATNASNPTGALSLAWVNTATNANGYRVNRSSDGVNFGQVAQLGSSAISYTNSGLTPGATYYYQVYAYNSAGSSSSNMASGQTQAVTTAPAAPSSPSPSNGATGVSTSATLVWTCSGATGYDVYINGALYAANRTSASVPTTLSAGTQYSWYVVAKNSFGSTSSPTWSFTTKAAAVVKGKGRK